MIGVITTGHGNFATGLTSALNLIVGEMEAYAAVDFTSLAGTAELERDLAVALDGLSAQGCEGVLVLCDLVGGSPFKTAVTLGAARGNVRVMAGTNLGCLVEACTQRDVVSDVDGLATLAVEAARAQVVAFQMAPVTTADDLGDDFDDEGI